MIFFFMYKEKLFVIYIAIHSFLSTFKYLSLLAYSPLSNYFSTSLGANSKNFDMYAIVHNSFEVFSLSLIRNYAAKLTTC